MSGFAGPSNRPSTGSSTNPNWRWWVPATGINRSVITSEIQSFLGQDALVKPGKGSGENQGVDGYWISGYRTLTSAMMQSLQEQSIRYENQKDTTTGRFQEPHHESRNNGARPTPPLTHGTSAYPPPNAPAPFTQDQGYPPQRQGQPIGYENLGYDIPGYAGASDPRDLRDSRELRDPRDPFYQQGGQPPYPSHGQPGVSPHAPQYVHPHYSPGAPVSQPDPASYGYTSPPAQYPTGPYPQGLNNGPRRDQYAAAFTGPPPPSYGYPTTPSDSSSSGPHYPPYTQPGHHPYR